MDTLKPKVPFYARRSFGEKMNATIDFLKDAWKPLLKFTTYLVLPLCLLQALSLNRMMTNTMALSTLQETGMYNENVLSASHIASQFLFLTLYFIGSMLVTSLVYACMQVYNSRENGLKGVTFKELTPHLFRNMKRFVLAFLFLLAVTTGFCIIMVLLAFIHPIIMVIATIGFIVCVLPLALFIPIYLFEDIGVIAALKKTFRMGFATWGGTFAILFIMGIIAGVLQGACSTPWYVLFMIKQLFAASDMGSVGDTSVVYNFSLYILGILQSYGTYIAMFFTMIGLAYQYAHASEKVDSVSIESDIDNFEQL